VSIASAPKDWDNVKSFNWSPDSKRLAVMLGTTDCDYPGSANGVFVTSLDLKSQSRVSPTGMALDPVFSPDGSAVALSTHRIPSRDGSLRLRNRRANRDSPGNAAR
jgi:Tol biopolymer transport system component